MDVGLQNGLFTVLGAIVAGLFSYLIARTNTKWQKAQSVISKLTEQVANYHKLEEFYMNRVAELDPSKPSAVTVQKNMRSEVEDLDGFTRPRMTVREARDIGNIWK